MAALAGKNGSFNLGNTAYAFREWTSDDTTDLVDVTSFSSAGYKENIGGLTGKKVTARGPYNQGAMAITSGTSYAAQLWVNASVSFNATVRIGNIRLVTEVSKAVEVEITGESTGSFTAAIT